MADERIAILFDIDGTLLITGGAGAASWRLAFDELYGIPADIGKFSDAGMTVPDVGRRTFQAGCIGSLSVRSSRDCSSAGCITCIGRSLSPRTIAFCPAWRSCYPA
jgi:hypothetical protein